MTSGPLPRGRQRASLDPWRPVKRDRRRPSSRCWSSGRPSRGSPPRRIRVHTSPSEPPERGVHRLSTWSDHTEGVRTDPDMSAAGADGAAAPFRSRAPAAHADRRLRRGRRHRARRTGPGQRGRAAHLPGVRRRGRRPGRRAQRLGIGRGDRVGVRVKSGTTDLYVAILGILLSGAAYVPVDADDPDERARLVFDEADVAAVVGNDLAVGHRGRRRSPHASPRSPAPDDDAWVIFTSGSTGTPKGVAVTHRIAAAFVDAESRLFLQDEPLGAGRPGDGRAVGRLRRLLRGDVAGLGATAPAWSRRRGRWSAAASTSGRGWSPTTSPSSPRCRRWSRCGRPSRWPASGC